MSAFRVDERDPFIYFARKIRRQLDGCWLWSGTPAQDTGYGWARGKESAHRFAFRLYVGEIPPGLCVLHSCDVRLCVRPDHLFLGTKLDNTADMIAKGRARHYSLEENRSSKLTSAQVLDARRRRAAGEGLRPLAREYGVSHTALAHAITGKNWATLPCAAPGAARAGAPLEDQLRASLAQGEETA